MDDDLNPNNVTTQVMSVTIDQDEPLWTVNLKRALVAQLQLQIDASSPVFYEAKHDTYNTPQKAEYSTMEVKFHKPGYSFITQIDHRSET